MWKCMHVLLCMLACQSACMYFCACMCNCARQHVEVHACVIVLVSMWKCMHVWLFLLACGCACDSSLSDLWLWKSSSCFCTLLLMLRRYWRLSHLPTTPMPYCRLCLSKAKCFTWEAMRRPRRGWRFSVTGVRGVLGVWDIFVMSLLGREMGERDR